jgi:hypothetical protein
MVLEELIRILRERDGHARVVTQRFFAGSDVSGLMKTLVTNVMRVGKTSSLFQRKQVIIMM